MDTDNDLALKSIAADLQIDSLSKEMQQEIIGKLGETALKNTVVAVLEKLPEENMSEFEKLSASGEAEKIHYFLKNHIPNFDELAKQEMKKVVDDFKRIKAGLS